MILGVKGLREPNVRILDKFSAFHHRRKLKRLSQESTAQKLLKDGTKDLFARLLSYSIEPNFLTEGLILLVRRSNYGNVTKVFKVLKRAGRLVRSYH